MQSQAFLNYGRYAVLGAGRSGVGAARLLLSRGCAVRLIDEAADPSRADLAPLAAAGGELRFGGLSANAAEVLDGCDAVVVSPGFPVDHPLLNAARADGLPLRSELELGWLCRGKGRVVAITGTNGKTTVTMLVERMLLDAGMPAVACGNIGLALSAAVLDAGEKRDGAVFVAEVSSFQLETIADFVPAGAMVLNVTPDHLDRHGTMEAYAAAKERIAEGQASADLLIVNQDDAWTLAMGSRAKSRVRRFSLMRPVDDGAWLDAEMIMTVEPGAKPKPLLSINEIQMLGMHNVANAMAAVCLCQWLGAPLKSLAGTLRAFKAAPHRLETVAEFEGVRYVNDSKGTNIDAMVQAIESFEGDVLLIAGGRDKASPFASVAERIAPRVRAAYLIGEAAAPMREAWAGRIDCRPSGTIDRALAEARSDARPGDIVLLSPGCASFDQFKNYAHRGETFAGIVRGWTASA